MHYFIDPALLSVQNSTDAFGPDNSDPANKYNVTSRFQLSSQARAFACIESMMIVQQSNDPLLVNIILRPVKALKAPFGAISYFVYRGLLKSSFINATDVAPLSAGSSEFISRFWTYWNDYKVSNPGFPDPTPQKFGYDTSLPGTLDIERIYDQSQTDVRAFLVKEGEWIGDFDSNGKIGIEIILQAESFALDLNYLKTNFYQVVVTGLSGFDLRITRELVLSYIDPCAFWGLYYEAGINISFYNGSSKTVEKKTENNLYSSLISKFATKNRVYLDIRNEKGDSYNFYQNYQDATGNNIKLGNSLVAPVSQVYGYNSWPIMSIDAPLVTTESSNNIKINLRIDDNVKPILFFENTNLLGHENTQKFIQPDEILNGTATDWSKELTFKFPNTGTASAKDNVAYYIRLNYFRQLANPSSPNTVIKSNAYFDLAFCQTGLKNLGNPQSFIPDVNYITGQFPGSTTNFGYVAESGAISDVLRIVFYAAAVRSNTSSGTTIPGVPLFAKNSGLNLSGVFPKNSFLKRGISVVTNEINESGVGSVEVLECIHNSASLGFKENLVLLCITQAQFQILKTLPGLNDKYKKYIFLEELSGSPFTDSSGITFRKFSLKLQGLDNSGINAIVLPSPSIYVYSKDGFTFSSKDFGAIENIDNKKKISGIYNKAKVYEWTGYIDDSREINFKQLIESTCVTIPSISPALLFTISIGEGLNEWLDANYDPSPPHAILVNNRVNGYDRLGVDAFGSDFSRYSPFLPSSYNAGDEFNTFLVTNENGDSFFSADFKDLKSALLGSGAVIAQRKKQFLKDARDLKYSNPNIDQVVFWTYVYHQGEGRAKTYLISNGGFDFTRKSPLLMTEVRRLALERLATWRYIKQSNLLSG